MPQICLRQFLKIQGFAAMCMFWRSQVGGWIRENLSFIPVQHSQPSRLMPKSLSVDLVTEAQASNGNIISCENRLQWKTSNETFCRQIKNQISVIEPFLTRQTCVPSVVKKVL